MRRLLIGVTLFVVQAACLVLTSGTSQAYNCSNPGNYHVSWNTNPGTTSRTDLYGAAMTADVQSPAFCSGGPNRFSNIYAMLKSNPKFLNTGWSQAGYERQPGDGIRDFAQIANGGALNTYYSSGSVATGQDRKYRVRGTNQAPCLNCVTNLVNGNAVLQGYTGHWASPFFIELSGEARHTQNDIAGTVGNKVNLDSLKYERKSDETFYHMPCGIFSNPSDSPRWHSNHVSCTHKQFWTDPTN